MYGHGPGQIDAGQPVKLGAGTGSLAHARKLCVVVHAGKLAPQARRVQGPGLQAQDPAFVADKLKHLVHQKLAFPVKVRGVDSRGADGKERTYDLELIGCAAL